MIKVQAWLQKTCRDVLDECDHILSLRTQLIYPSGAQLTHHPHRWETAEALLKLVYGHLWNLQKDFPHSVEVERRAKGGYPIVHFLRSDVEDALLRRLVDDICDGRTSILPIRERPSDEQLAIKHFISGVALCPGIVECINHSFPDRQAAKQNTFLVRGLLAHGILLLCLKNRWNVQYGLHPTRDPIAVPYHAKGVPSEQAEWGHPDVASCLRVLRSTIPA